MKKEAKIKVEWPEDKGIVACAVRRGVPTRDYSYNAIDFLREKDIELYATRPDWEVIMRPKPEPRYYAACPGELSWLVYERGAQFWMAHFDGRFDPDAERHAREFADMLNREDGELVSPPHVFLVEGEWRVTDGHDYEVVAMRGREAERAARAYAASRGTAPSKWATAFSDKLNRKAME